MKPKEKENNAKVSPKTVSVSAKILPPTVWISANFAERWFADTKSEAKTGKDHHSLRREILFATCFLESYIYEWTRRVVGVEAINDYYPATPRSEGDPRYRRRLKEKWRQIPGELQNDKKISINSQLDLSKLGILLKYRNGLVHASASRPVTDDQPEEEKPFPSLEELKQLNPGWALDIAVDLVHQLHGALGSTPPDYCIVD